MVVPGGPAGDGGIGGRSQPEPALGHGADLDQHDVVDVNHAALVVADKLDDVHLEGAGADLVDNVDDGRPAHRAAGRRRGGQPPARHDFGPVPRGR
jgi:hypothetical protein